MMQKIGKVYYLYMF